jgi:hypothetical protein
MRITTEQDQWEEEVDRRAQEYFETARAEGSLLPDADLMKEARGLADRDMRHVQSLADDELPAEDEP